MGKYRVCVYAICKNESQFVERWLKSMSEADVIVVLDTGSTDSTIELLRSTTFKDRTIVVHQEEIKPWRFDVARNKSLELVPEDVDICVSTDLDEFFEEGWREKLEAGWVPGNNLVGVWYNWKHDSDGNPIMSYIHSKIHSRKNYEWSMPAHEYLLFTGNGDDNKFIVNDITLNHFPDNTKSRAFYLPLLELAVEENPSNRQLFYLGREYFLFNRWEDSIRILTKYVNLPSSFYFERCNAMRYIAKAYATIEDHDNADKWFYLAMFEAPAIREAYVDYANHTYQRRDWIRTLLLTTQAMKITDKHEFFNEENSWDTTIYDLAGISSYQLGMYEKAYEYFSEAIDIKWDERIKKNLIFAEDKMISNRITQITHQPPSIIPKIDGVIHPGNNIHYPMTEGEILNIPPTNRIFVFWQNLNSKPSPEISVSRGYITLCIETLLKTNPTMHIFFINHYNMKMVLGENELDWVRLTRLPLFQQSDLIKVSCLLKYGGIFSDANHIFTGSIDWMLKFQPDTLVILGERGCPITDTYRRAHMVFSLLAVRSPNNQFLYRMSMWQKESLGSMPLDDDNFEFHRDSFGDTMSDSIIGPIKDPNQIFLFDRWRCCGSPTDYGFSFYNEGHNDFWYKDNEHISIDQLISKANCNMIWISNFCSPDNVKNMTRDEILSKNFVLSRLFKRILDGEEIVKTQPIEYGSCDNINEFSMAFISDMFDDGIHIAPCCVGTAVNGMFVPGIKLEDDAEQTMDNYIQLRDHLITSSKNGNPNEHCLKCIKFYPKVWNPEQKIKRVNFSMYPAPCQSKCIYCHIHCNHESSSKFDTNIHTPLFEKYFSLLDVAISRGLIDNDAEWEVASGEISIHPFKDRILDYVKGKNTIYYTNCFIFDRRIADELSNNPRARMIISVDAGTPKTWERVKGFNNFKDFRNVVSLYRSHTKHSDQIVIKYIILPGINDSDDDYNGIINTLGRFHIRSLRIAGCIEGDYTFDDVVSSGSRLISILTKNDITISYDALNSHVIQQMEHDSKLL